jgi:hypothetical protein
MQVFIERERNGIGIDGSPEMMSEDVLQVVRRERRVLRASMGRI